MTMNEFINQRRKELGISLDDLADISGVPKGTVSKITSGINTNPKLSTLQALCKALECTLDDALSEEKSSSSVLFTPAELLHIKKYRTLDEYGKRLIDSALEIEYERCSCSASTAGFIEIKLSEYHVSAGTGVDLGGNDSWSTIRIPDSSLARKADFALMIKGDSMEPVYHNNDIVLIRQQDAVDIGDVGIFIIGGEGFIKKYEGDRLVSLNADYDDILFAEHNDEYIRCVGKALGTVQEG